MVTEERTYDLPAFTIIREQGYAIALFDNSRELDYFHTFVPHLFDGCRIVDIGGRKENAFFLGKLH